MSQLMSGASGAEVGSSIIWNHATPPAGYLEENGAAISRATYAALFAVVGTMYGVGDGETTFNIPDKRGEFLRGFANGSANDPDRAGRTNRGDGVAGDNVGTKQGSQYASHGHSASFAYSTSNNGSIISVGGVAGAYTGSYGVSVSAAGGNETRGRNINVMYCIKY